MTDILSATRSIKLACVFGDDGEFVHDVVKLLTDSGIQVERLRDKAFPTSKLVKGRRFDLIAADLSSVSSRELSEYTKDPERIVIDCLTTGKTPLFDREGLAWLKAALSKGPNISTPTYRKLFVHAYELARRHSADLEAITQRWSENTPTPENIHWPAAIRIQANFAIACRYGENPHQFAAAYVSDPSVHGVLSAEKLQGKALSFNNLNDTDAALELVAEFSRNRAAVAIIKHANPCGVALATSLAEAYDCAFACDPVSAFGGIVAVNREIDEEVARKMSSVFSEVIIAPAISAEAEKILAKKKNLRVLITGGLPNPKRSRIEVRSVTGGYLLQSRDNGTIDDLNLKVVTKRQPSARELADLKFAFRVAKHVKSNAIVYVKNGATVGIGAGQMSRVDSARIAALKAEDAAKAAGLKEPMTRGSVVASDAFFPFADGLITAADAGVTAVIQPGGSMRDEEVIKEADARGLAMVFTGMRHFRH